MARQSIDTSRPEDVCLLMLNYLLWLSVGYLVRKGFLFGEVQCEQPNNSLYEKLSFIKCVLVLEGCSLKNTDYVVGTVIFTGLETKVMMNSMNVPSKRSTLEKKLDKVILALFCLLLCMCLIEAIGRKLTFLMEQMKSRQPKCPQLYIYSSANKVIPAEFVEFFIAEQKRIEHEVRACNFISTPHVDHMRNHPELYKTQLTEYLEDYGLTSCKQDPRH